VIDSIETMEARLRIYHCALVANYRLLKSRVAPADLAAVVKADGYGLGAAPVARTLAGAGCRHFFVAQLGEAIALRPHLPPEAQMYILNGFHRGGEAACESLGAIPVINSLDQLDHWAAHARASGIRLPAVLQVDSGMSRLGLSASEASALAATPERLDGIDLRLVLSHLACADEPHHPANEAQADAFAVLTDLFPNVPKSLDNSAGALLPRGHFDLVRAGIGLYGGAPHIDTVNPMQPVVSLDARIIQTRHVASGVGVGYGLSFVATRARRIATIGVGYADGWPRNLGNRGHAFIDGIRIPIVGRISMDTMTLDVTDVPEAHTRPGAEVELLGPHQSIDDVAREAGTIGYEILTRLGRRYAREHMSADVPVPAELLA
jgi:alanine racemase